MPVGAELELAAVVRGGLARAVRRGDLEDLRLARGVGEIGIGGLGLERVEVVVLNIGLRERSAVSA